MTALATKRNTPEKASSFAMAHEQGVAAAQLCFVGALVCVDTTDGFITPGAVSTTLIAAGVVTAEEDGGTGNADNGSGADGDINVRFRSGIFFFANDGGTAVVQADVGSDCFILDDQTVSGDNTGRSVAGKVYQVDGASGLYGAGVWVAISYPPMI